MVSSQLLPAAGSTASGPSRPVSRAVNRYAAIRACGTLAYRPSRLSLERDSQAGPHLDPDAISGRRLEAGTSRHLHGGLIDANVLADRLHHLNVFDAALLVDQDG